jgi:prepilin peptidase CpaA
MTDKFAFTGCLLLFALAVVITYYDVKYRRIPNAFVAATLISGIIINLIWGGTTGIFASLAGCGVAFALMLTLHIFGALGAGDVKLFAAVGAVIGLQMVPMTFLIVLITGGLLAIVATVRAGLLQTTLQRVLMIFAGLLPGWPMPRFSVPADRRHTIPYGVAITLGSLISLAIFRD